MANESLRIHRFLPSSKANGPGNRAVLWVQGCTLGCPGCFNPETHSFLGGTLITIEQLWRKIKAAGDIEGLTISGGEPLQQRRALLRLLRGVRQTSLSVLLFTGFTWDEVQQMPEADDLLACIDVLIAGRYEVSQRMARDLRGSANKTIHFLTDRYTPDDMHLVPEAEVVIDVDGEVILSGINPVRW